MSLNIKCVEMTFTQKTIRVPDEIWTHETLTTEVLETLYGEQGWNADIIATFNIPI